MSDLVVVLWLVINILGLSVSYFTWNDARQELTEARTRGLDTPTVMYLASVYRSQSFRLLLIMVFLVIGVLIGAHPEPPPRPEWVSTLVRIGFLTAAGTVATDSFLTWRDKRKLLRSLDTEFGLMSGADEDHTHRRIHPDDKPEDGAVELT